MLKATAQGNIEVYNSKMLSITAGFNNKGDCVIFKNLSANESYYVSFTPVKEGSFTLSAQEYEPAAASPDSFFCIKAAPGTPVCVKVTQDTTGVIEAYCDCINGRLTIYDSNFGYLSHGTSGEGGSTRASAAVATGKDCYIVVDPIEAGEYGLSFMKVSPLTIGSEPIELEAEKRTNEFVTFTPLQSGFYDYTVTSKEPFVRATAPYITPPLYTSVYTSECYYCAGGDVYDQSATIKAWFNAGHTYYMSFKPYAAGTHTVSANPTALTDIEADKAYEISIDTVFITKPELDGSFSFTTTNQDAYIKVYNSEGNIVAAKNIYEKISELKFNLTGGETYYIAVFPGTGGGVYSLSPV